jgi:hypothetical protein
MTKQMFHGMNQYHIKIKHMKALKLFFLASVLIFWATAASSQVGNGILYVSKQNGNNKNDGSKGAPLKNLDKAIALAAPGTTIYMAGGVEMGTLNVGFIESDKPVKIYGSYDETFTTQDIVNHPTLIQPDNESARSTRKAVMKFTRDVAGTVLDHLVFDGGERNAYHVKEGIVEGVEGGGRLLPATERPPVGYPTVDEPLLQFVSATTGGCDHRKLCLRERGQFRPSGRPPKREVHREKQRLRG